MIMIFDDLVFLRTLGDSYGSCWVQTLFADGRPWPKCGLTVGERPVRVEWEEDWSIPQRFPPRTSDSYWEQIIYSRVFVRGTNCSLRQQGEVIELNGDLLLSNSKISVPVSTRRFIAEWLLEGCADLPQFSAVLDDVSEIRESLDAPSNDQLRSMALKVGPRPGARLGFTRHREWGALSFMEQLAPRKFLVESLSVIAEDGDQPLISTQYTSPSAKVSQPVVFAREVQD